MSPANTRQENRRDISQRWARVRNWLISMFTMLLFTAVLYAAFVNIKTLYLNPGPKLLFRNSNFELGSLEGWYVEGEAFKNQPVAGDNSAVRGRGSAAMEGQYWIGTYEGPTPNGRPEGLVQGDTPQGVLRSISFTINGNAISFRIGGGNGTEDLSVSLFVDGQMIKLAHGFGYISNSEAMDRVIWDVSKWRDQAAQIVIADRSPGYWGHINADDFRYYWGE